MPKFGVFTGNPSVTILRLMRKVGITFLVVVLFALSAIAQEKRTLDKIVAVVGNNIILKSDIETNYANYLAGGGAPNPDLKCQVVANLISQKLLAAQAVIDSVMVKDDEVDNEVDRRWRGMVQRAGGEDKIEALLGRSGLVWKDEIRPDVKELLVAQKMRAKITEKVNTTPQDVEKFFKSIKPDSIPTISKEVEVGEIEIDPKLTSAEKDQYRQKAQQLLDRVKNGEDFAVLATAYSKDPGSAIMGGDLGFGDRTTYVKEFTANAFKLKPGEYAPVFESEYGFHVLQLIERRGEQIHTRHILITPQITEESVSRAKLHADTVYDLLKKAGKPVDVFANFATNFSDNKESKFTGGMLLNQDNVQVRTTLIPTERLDPQVALVIDTLKVGAISKPVLMVDNTGKKSYKILYLKSVVDAHKANLGQDFPRIKEAATEAKIARSMSEWFDKKKKENYIKIDPEFQGCPQTKGWASPVTTAQVNK